jgi:hypothetical protein
MVGASVSGKYVKVLSSLAAIAMLAGCSSTDTGSMFGQSKKTDETPADPNKTPVVMQGQCPLVFLREGTAIYTQYSKAPKKNKKADAEPAPPQDPNSLVMQATLDRTTRQCFQTAQGLRVTVVVRGRLVLGPAGTPGSAYTLPIRVAATDGDQTLYSELQQYQVQLPPGETSMQFIYTRDDVMLNQVDPGGLTRLFAGIDEGPYKTK